MAVSGVFALVVVACIFCSALEHSPLAAAAAPSHDTSKPPTHSPAASPISPAHAPTKNTPPASSPSPSVKPPSTPRHTPLSPAPSVAFPPSPNFAPQPSKNGAVVNSLGFAAASAGFFAFALMA